MHILIVFTHPSAGSLTAFVVREIADALAAEHSVVVADLAAEQFSPAFSVEDVEAYRTIGAPPDDVRFEQERVSLADSIVFVYPVYWWGTPALLKGWIERVFTNGWAYGSTADGRRATALRGKRIHLVGIGASGSGTYSRRGYLAAMRTTLEHGVFEYCDAPVSSSRILHHSERGDLEERLTEFLAATVGDIRRSLLLNVAPRPSAAQRDSRPAHA